jgi:uncharacterized protein Yka (UPF0111/DUF47 family)
MTAKRWFLPRTPDVLGALRAQTAVTVEGLDALAAWAAGDEAAADRVRDCEHLADDRKRELRAALSEAFSTPLEPEDIFQLSTGLDTIMNSAKNIVRETEVLDRGPDPTMAELAQALAEGTRHLAEAFAALGDGGGVSATAAADAALDSQHGVERAYRAGMSALLQLPDLHEVAARRELYRRLARTSDSLKDVAERVWYSVLKES